ncbi:BON domain-containing protein [Varunaivibrio sulfuroxidans]|uniref:BON domain-containing protein n=1 Tax=Varunaivibrio sulfuroxidans TaxID=1773489 RepID=A0A4R3JGB1_9PROT|nr:BON domain-containing protein [Varunaivibrio sulfuroxidans]TCS64246.1 BON domain-containing protein [Varunaivibrio sulfuroxidans]WES31313.1 BON domain-containing protein [Varunaivibrio sulfuroxidans]
MYARAKFVAALPRHIPVLVLALFLGACGTQGVVVQAVQAPFENRLAEQQVVDAKIKTALLERLAKIDKMLLIDVTVDVWKREVLLTGALESPSLRAKVLAAAHADARTKKIYDEIQIVSAARHQDRRDMMDKAKAGAARVGDALNDVWIETKIKGQLVAAKDVGSINYRWRSVFGVVSIIGEARTPQERRTVESIIRHVEGVRKLNAFISIASH